MRAPRGDIHVRGYYEDISDEDSVFDIINEINDIRGVRDANELQQSILDFDLEYYQDDITLGDDGEAMNESVINDEYVTTIDHAENVTLNYDEDRKVSVSMDDDVNSNGPVDDDDTVNCDKMTNDRVNVNVM